MFDNNNTDNKGKKWTPEDKALLSKTWDEPSTFETWIESMQTQLGRNQGGVLSQINTLKSLGIYHGVLTFDKVKSKYEANQLKLSSKNHLNNDIFNELMRVFAPWYDNHGQLIRVSAPTGTGKSYALREVLKNIFKNAQHVEKGGNDKYYLICPSYRLMRDYIAMCNEEGLDYVVLTGQQTLHSAQFGHNKSKPLHQCPALAGLDNKTKEEILTLEKTQSFMQIPIVFKKECHNISGIKSNNRSQCQYCQYKHPFEIVKELNEEKKPVVILTTMHKLFFNIQDFNKTYRFDPSKNVADVFQNATFILDESTEIYNTIAMSSIDDINIFELLNNVTDFISNKEFEKNVNIHILNRVRGDKHIFPHYLNELNTIENKILDFIQTIHNTYYHYINNFKPHNQNTPIPLDKKIKIFGTVDDISLPLYHNIFSSELLPDLNKSIHVNIYEHSNNTYSLISNKCKEYLDGNTFIPKFQDVGLHYLIESVFLIFIKLNEQFYYFYRELSTLCDKYKFESAGYPLEEDITRALRDIQYQIFKLSQTISSRDGEEIDDMNFLLSYSFIDALNQRINSAVPFITSRQSVLDHGFEFVNIADAEKAKISNLHEKNVLLTLSRYQIMPLLKAMRKESLNNNLILSSANANFDSIALNPDPDYLCAGEKPMIVDSVQHILEQNPSLSKDSLKNINVEICPDALYQNNEYNIKQVSESLLSYLQKINKPILGVIYLNSHNDVKNLEYQLNNRTSKSALSNTKIIKILEGGDAQFIFDKEVEEFKKKLLKDKKSTPPRLLVITAYATLSTGINLQLSVTKEEYETSQKTQNNWLFDYVQSNINFNAPAMNFDINFYMNVVSKSYASGSALKSLICHYFDGAVDIDCIKKYEKIKDMSEITKVLKNKQTNVLAMLVPFFQSLGRINRSFANPADTYIYLAKDTPEIFQNIGECLWNYVPETNLYKAIANSGHSKPIVQTRSRNGASLLQAFYKKQPGLSDALIRLDTSIANTIEELRQTIADISIFYEQSKSSQLNYSYLKKELKHHCDDLNAKAKLYNVSSNLIVEDFIVKHSELAKCDTLFTYPDNYVISNHALNKNSQRHNYHKESKSDVLGYKDEFLHPSVLLQIAQPKLDELKFNSILSQHRYNIYTQPKELNELADGFFHAKTEEEWLLALDYKSYSLNHTLDTILLNDFVSIRNAFPLLESKIQTIQNNIDVQNVFSGHVCYILCINNERVYPTEQRYAQVNNGGKKEWVTLSEAKRKSIPVLSLLIVMTSEKLHTIDGSINYATRGKI